MNAISFQPILYAVVVCITFILILSLYVSIRSRSFTAGLRLFLLFTLPLGLISVFLFFYLTRLSESVQQFTIISMFLILIVAMAIQGFLWWLNTKRGGRILHQKENSLVGIVRYAILAAFVPTLLLLYWMNPTPGIGIVVVLVWGIVSVVFIYRAMFEIREKGFILQGKFISFTDVEQAWWENILDKTKLCLRLKSTDKIVIIKTPWEMITPIDDYIRTNFPRS